MLAQQLMGNNIWSYLGLEPNLKVQCRTAANSLCHPRSHWCMGNAYMKKNDAFLLDPPKLSFLISEKWLWVGNFRWLGLVLLLFTPLGAILKLLPFDFYALVYSRASMCVRRASVLKWEPASEPCELRKVCSEDSAEPGLSWLSSDS